MGFGGRTSLIGCKIGALEPPAGELLRLGRVRLLGVPPAGRRPRRPHRRDQAVALSRSRRARWRRWPTRRAFQRTGREVALRTPLTEEQVRALKVGDVVLISGRVYTGRDAVHAHLMKHEPPVDLRRFGAVSLRPGRGERGRRLAGDRRGPHDQHPRGAVSGRHHPPLRCARGHRARAAWAARRWPR